MRPALGSILLSAAVGLTPIHCIPVCTYTVMYYLILLHHKSQTELSIQLTEPLIEKQNY